MRKLAIFVACLGMLGFTRFGKPVTSCVPAGTYTIQVHIKEPREIAQLYHAHGGDPQGHAKGFVASTESGTLALIVPVLRGATDSERLEVWGHELAHIVCGPRYHDE